MQRSCTRCKTTVEESIHEPEANLVGVGGNGSDVCNVVAFFEGWNCVDVEDDTGNASVGLEYEFAEIVGDKADFTDNAASDTGSGSSASPAETPAPHVTGMIIA